MELKSALKSQYHAALGVLREDIEKCPDAMWNDPADEPAPFWRVAYHALFFAHFYLQQDEKSFSPWARHRAEAQFFDRIPWENRAPHPVEPYTREDIMEYWDDCDGMVDGCIDALDLSAAQCGFPWYPMSTLEHQIVNIRHIQHHAAILSYRLRRTTDIKIPWIGGKPPKAD